jgi:hypothetical protein
METLDEKTERLLQAAKSQAIRIIEQLDPEYITSFNDLEAKMKDGMERLKKMREFQETEVLDPSDGQN